MKTFFLITAYSILTCTVCFADTTQSTTSSVTKTVNVPITSTGNAVTKSTTISTTKISTVDDDNIVSTIYSKFAKDSALIGTTLTAVSENGIVTLSGTVTAQSQADRAVELAKSITTVKDVRSTINVITNPAANKQPPPPPKY